MELEGQAAIVTGAGRGIGRAIALELARLGADVIVAELSRDTAEETAAAVQALGRKALNLHVDVTRRADLDMMAFEARRRFGRIDILVNNAGIYRGALPQDVTEEHWDSVMAVNAKAVFFASQAVLPAMVEAQRGAIVSLASMAGKVGTVTSAPYAASKAVVISITKSLALAYAPHGIRVNCVCPGYVQTEMWEEVYRQSGAAIQQLEREEFDRRRVQAIPLGRMETPEDVAMVVGFLASERARYMTGQAINVTGGMVMH
jgi:NAD(P)-dependent dehydrogenase (short-subunit alcohol dehydrogenase family)